MGSPQRAHGGRVDPLAPPAADPDGGVAALGDGAPGVGATTSGGKSPPMLSVSSDARRVGRDGASTTGAL